MQAIQLFIAVFVLVIGEIFIYNVAIASNLPFLLKWLAILALPIAAGVGLFARFKS